MVGVINKTMNGLVPSCMERMNLEFGSHGYVSLKLI